MNANEPVAWTNKDELAKYRPIIAEKEYSIHFPIPLYIHPVNPKYDPETGEPLIDGYPLFSGLPHPVKELTDEEITELKNALKDCEYKIYPSKKQWESYLVLEKYAERLLRKAQNV